MRAEDIHTYEDLQKYVKMELAQQTLKRRIIQLEFNDEWFFKFAKLIQFSLKHDDKEVYSRQDIEPECKKYILKINKILTIVTRK